MQKIGETGNNPKKPDSGEYLTGNYQEIFAEVIFEKVSAKSAVIDVGIMEEPKKQENVKSPAIKKNDKSPRKTESCVCKDEYKLIWGNKISCSERKKVVEVCKNIWEESKKLEKAKELMSIMHLETGGSFSPSQKGVSARGTKYIGLVQFSETTAQSLGTTYETLGKMTFLEQMTYVEKYLQKNKDQMNTLVDFYLQVLNPAAVGKGSDPTYKVFDESVSVPDGDCRNTSEKQRLRNITKDPWVKKYGYASNPPFMKGDERTKRKKWVYTRQRYEDRYGYENGNTTIKEIDDVVRLEHYNPGQAELYVDKCEDKPVGKKDDQGKRAPWVDVAFSEFEKFKGKREKDSPLKERISQYFKGTGNSDLNYKSAWCAAFVRWCFDQTEEYKDTNTKGTAAAFDWAEFGNSKVVSNKYVDGWSNGSRSEPFVGAVIVFSWSHVAFIVSENKDKSKYVYIGGNQTGWEGKTAGTQVISMSSISKKSSDIFAIMKPKDYVIDDAEKQLPTYNVESENDFNSTR
ncbi:CHAP domain-containing protein [Chryseobacterium salipaludis]|uniref:CHAP domain-containing protein n=1 Tax=Chryseobacterium TaxID=59732 RepID=UPI001FF3B8D2|nr:MULTISPECIES: CHAP domain-containing protein [Chryseobacterium]MCJ8497633.1 CHAP domain-containing protein [Chryseobacterium salipaludis]MCX3296042.1 CHAP domain-containing protein [Planobacterium sp. JC490]